MCVLLLFFIIVFTQFCSSDTGLLVCSVTYLPQNLGIILAICQLPGIDSVFSKRLHILQLVIQPFHLESLADTLSFICFSHVLFHYKVSTG